MKPRTGDVQEMKKIELKAREVLEMCYRMPLIKRWQIIRTRRSQSIAEHSYLVSIIATALLDILPDHILTDKLRLYVVQKALKHDAGEIYTGDIPSPIRAVVKSVLLETSKAGLQILPPFFVSEFLEPDDQIDAGGCLHNEPLGDIVVDMADLLEAWIFTIYECVDPNLEFILADLEKSLDERIERLGEKLEAYELPPDEIRETIRRMKLNISIYGVPEDKKRYNKMKCEGGING